MKKTIASIAFAAVSATAPATDLYVGAGKTFTTVQAAVDRAAELAPAGEADRVVIHIAPGVYREQVSVRTPYVSFVNDTPDAEARITWYYGIGYKYFSVNANGVYDSASAKSRSAKRTPSHRWGATVLLAREAAHFRARGVVFENSFNRYMTEEELADGVEPDGNDAVSRISFVRKAGADVASRAAKERAAALATDAPDAVFERCSFLSGQDTLYVGASPSRFADCLVEGNTDYIFGDADTLFERCELRFRGNSDVPHGGVVTAVRDDADDDGGFVFRSCRITRLKGMKHRPGHLGRPWRVSAKVQFIDTVVEDEKTIDPSGWTSMSGVQPEQVEGFRETGTRYPDGRAVDLSRRRVYQPKKAL